MLKSTTADELRTSMIADASLRFWLMAQVLWGAARAYKEMVVMRLQHSAKS